MLNISPTKSSFFNMEQEPIKQRAHSGLEPLSDKDKLAPAQPK